MGVTAMNRSRLACAAALVAALFALIVPATGADKKTAAKLDKDEAKKAFDYLNKVRQAPDKYSKEIGVDLSDVKPRPELKWNDDLAKAAQDKALDMAERDYF